ncbi:MAG: aminodeoxychorismate synthase component I [Chitinispirillaceae bacterium]|nr:aminodeoxychorismate synthase component I [Chitinispirillaceae bacterium]
MNAPVAAVCRNGSSWLFFNEPHAVVTTSQIEEVTACLQRIAQYTASGFYAAGFIGYEAAAAFDPALVSFPPDEVPLLWFGIFRDPVAAATLPATGFAPAPPIWQPSITYDSYIHAVERIKSHIAAGDTYQVNYTFRLTAPFTTDPWEYFTAVAVLHPAPFAAYINAGRFHVCSFSPELFFSLDGTAITMQPMKGTARRGAGSDEDVALEQRLLKTAKERAENIMIVDMIRNDIGRIARSGSVHVSELCAIRRYPTLLQMVSTVEGEVTVTLPELFGALFPCASITGAPKIQTCSIIRDLETTPRHVYCGAVGYWGPQGESRFNVAIRTLLVDTEKQQAEYGTGSGIVWDSVPEAEFGECMLKTAVVNPKYHMHTTETVPNPLFVRGNGSATVMKGSVGEGTGEPLCIVETMLWTSGEGYFLLDAHLKRLMNTAVSFGVTLDEVSLRERLLRTAGALTGSRYRVRLTVDLNGGVVIVTTEFPGVSEAIPLPVRLAAYPVESSDPYLYVKTTRRRQYTIAQQNGVVGEELLFFNEREELTEMSIGNVVLEMRDGKRYTPPVSCGLLPGVFREHCLTAGTITERTLRVEELQRAVKVFRINSVRRWQECRITGYGSRNTATIFHRDPVCK